MKKIFVLFLLFFLTGMSSLADDFDSSIDADIRKEYVENSNLPPLPSAAPAIHQTTTGEKKPSATVLSYKPLGKTFTIKHGTKVNIVSKTKISDWMHKGQVVSFSSLDNIPTKEGTVIPAGTIFKGRITDAHRPQITSNGGLVELYIDEIYFNGLISKINTKISLVNSKRIYNNDIKGKHSYWHNFYKSLEPGRKVYNGATKCADVFLPIPVVNILAIIPWTFGAVVYTVNFVASPVIAIFSKGGSVSLPAGTAFEVKFKENSQIRG